VIPTPNDTFEHQERFVPFNRAKCNFWQPSGKTEIIPISPEAACSASTAAGRLSAPAASARAAASGGISSVLPYDRPQPPQQNADRAALVEVTHSAAMRGMTPSAVDVGVNRLPP
jgi:hypothetical protein